MPFTENPKTLINATEYVCQRQPHVQPDRSKVPKSEQREGCNVQKVSWQVSTQGDDQEQMS